MERSRYIHGAAGCFEKVVASIGTLITIDKNIDYWKEVECARLHMRLPIEGEKKSEYEVQD